MLRPLLLLGGERTLVLCSGVIAGALVLSFGDLALAGVGIAFWIVILAVLQRMAKHDPELSRVYMRHLNKRLFYPARSHHSSIERPVKRQQ